MTVSRQTGAIERYWKCNIVVDGLDSTRSKIIEHGLLIGECFDVKGLAYLCHLTDYCIEIIHKNLKNALKAPRRMGSESFNLSTLKIKSIEKGIKFYTSIRIQLSNTYRSEESKMTLFFLVFEKDSESIRKPSNIIQEESLW